MGTEVEGFKKLKEKMLPTFLKSGLNVNGFRRNVSKLY